MVPAVREAVNRTGQPQQIAYLHLIVAAMEGQNGRYDEAQRHCEAAESLLELAPHAWLRCTSLANKSALAIIAGEFDRAHDILRSLDRFSRSSALTRETTEAQVNLGYIDLCRGFYRRAESALAEVVTAPASSLRAKLVALETIARARLAVGDLDSCEAHLNQLETLITAGGKSHQGYARRRAIVTRARLLLKRGEPAEAVALLDEALLEHTASSDAVFVTTAQITEAQALSRIGQRRKSAQALLRAELAGATQVRDVQAQYYYAAGDTIGISDPALSYQLRDRARRLWEYQGIVALQREMESVPAPRDQGRKSHRHPAAAVNALGSIIDLAHSPSVLGEELVRTLAGFGINATVTGNVPSPGDVADAEMLPLGADRGRPLWLVCGQPEEPDKAVLLQDVLRVGRAAVELERYKADERRRSAVWPEDPIEDQLGALFISPEMRTILASIRRMATTTATVLITGETGTGKEVVARLLHAYSQRAKAPFVAFNCTSSPKDMLDSQLFGHRRGAFTGAIEHAPGIVRSAERGTLLLDEVGDMPLDLQPKLLRFLESGEVHPVGEARPSKVDVRIIAATNTRLETLIAKGLFREDLYYRLNIVEVRLPPLRERRADIPPLANHYLKKGAAENRKGDLRLAEDTMEYLLLYQWPGNVRQLANEMRRLAVMAESGATLMPEHLSTDIAASRRTVPAAVRPADPREVTVRLDQPLAAMLEHVERTAVQRALAVHEGNLEGAAAMLGLTRKGLYLKRQRYGFEFRPGSNS
jgi:DNA-binding NtrC family response regulator